MVPRETRGQAVRKFTPHETGRSNPLHPMKTESHTYTVGRSEGVVYPPHVGPAPNAIQLAELYDKAAQRIAALEHRLKLYPAMFDQATKRIYKLEHALKLCPATSARAKTAKRAAFATALRRLPAALDPDLQ